MKIYNKLFAIIIAMLGVQTLSAQTWTAPVIGQDLKDVSNSTELYMYNVKADAFAASGMSWGTHAIVKELQNGDSKLSADVHRCRVSKPTDGQLQIMLNERSFLGGGGPTSTNDCWVDHGSNNVYIYNEVSDNVYTLKPTTATNDSYLDCSWKYGGHITFSATNGYGNTEWAFVLRSDITSGKYLLYKAKKEMYDIYAAVKEAGHDDTYAEALAIANVAYNDANATAATVNAATKVLLTNVAPALTSGYFSANSLFNNPDMRGYGDDTDWGNGLNAFGDGIFESWHSSETVTQSQVSLPNGFYTVEFIGIYRQDGGDAAPTLTLTSGSNSAKANLKALTEIDFGNCSGNNKWTGANKPDDKYSAGEALAHTDANVRIENFVVENGELTVTVAMPSGNQWLLCQGFRISFKAESVEEYANLFNEAKAAADAIDPATLNTYTANVLSTALLNAENEQIDKAWYQAHTAELNDAVALANEIVAPYADAKALFTICENILNNSQEFVDGAKTTFSTAVNTAKTDVETATTADAINDIYNTLETARQTYVVKADPTNDTYFDYTFLMTNPAVANGDGWTGARTNSGEQYTGAPDNTYWDSWDGAGQNIYQELTGLLSGLYTLKAAGRASTSCTSAYIYLNDTKAEIDKAGNTGNVLGYGWNWYTTEKTAVAVAGTAKVGFGCNTASSQWAGADDFHLYYYGFDAATAQTGVATLKAEAEALVGKPMNAGVATALNEAIASADATKTTRLELQPMIDALSTAVANAKTWIAAYNEAKAPLVAAFERFEADYNDGANGPARAMTTDMWTTLLEAVQVAAVAKDVTDSYDGFAQAAKDFNDAMDAIDNAYAAEGLLQDMTSLIANADCKDNGAWLGSGRSTLIGEHWSGDANRVYFTQNHENGAARTQTVTLPKTGTYYLKVAVRAVVAGSYVDIIINGKSNKTTGAHGRVGGTIATDGTEWESVEAGIEAGKTFANDNKGYGWVYKHIYFDAEAGEATIALSLSNVNINREANVGGMELYYVTIGDELILNDTESVGDVDGWYKSVTVNRTIKADVWNTFVVPFSMTKPDGWEVKELTGSNANGDNITLNFSDAQDGIKSGVPYMVRVKDQVSTIEVENVTVNTTLNNASTGDIDFVGVYESGNVPAGSFFISSNTFYRAADESNTLKAFRAYLTPANVNVKSVGYTFDDDDFTAIEGVEDAEAEVVAVYGADGAFRTGLQKGLNIVKLSNGKVQKVLVK